MNIVNTLHIICAIFMVIRAISILIHIKDTIYTNSKILQALLYVNEREKSMWENTQQPNKYTISQVIEAMMECDEFERKINKQLDNMPFKVACHQILISSIYGLSAYLLWP